MDVPSPQRLQVLHWSKAQTAETVRDTDEGRGRFTGGLGDTNAGRNRAGNRKAGKRQEEMGGGVGMVRQNEWSQQKRPGRKKPEGRVP